VDWLVEANVLEKRDHFSPEDGNHASSKRWLLPTNPHGDNPKEQHQNDHSYEDLKSYLM
jgi:hypothetical protein